MSNLNFLTLRNLELVAQFLPDFAFVGFVRQPQRVWLPVS
jgi:hypothetical protein